MAAAECILWLHDDRLVGSSAVSPRPGAARLIRQTAADGWLQAIVTAGGRASLQAADRSGQVDDWRPDGPSGAAPDPQPGRRGRPGGSG